MAFGCFPSPVWVGHAEVSVISGTDEVLISRALGHDTERELEGFPWLYTAVHQSLQGKVVKEEVLILLESSRSARVNIIQYVIFIMNRIKTVGTGT